MPTPALNVLMASRDLCGLGRDDIGTLVTGAAAGALFVTMFQVSTNKWQIDDVLGVWALYGLSGLWGGIACGIFSLEMLGGIGGVSFASQLVGSIGGAAFGFLAGTAVYGVVDRVFGFRMSPDDERRGADLSIHKIGANPEDDFRMGGRLAASVAEPATTSGGLR